MAHRGCYPHTSLASLSDTHTDARTRHRHQHTPYSLPTCSEGRLLSCTTHCCTTTSSVHHQQNNNTIATNNNSRHAILAANIMDASLASLEALLLGGPRWTAPRVRGSRGGRGSFPPRSRIVALRINKNNAGRACLPGRAAHVCAGARCACVSVNDFRVPLRLPFSPLMPTPLSVSLTHTHMRAHKPNPPTDAPARSHFSFVCATS